MKKFLVLYRMDMGEMQKMMASTSAEDRKKSMGEWEVWMKKNNSSFVDSGAPVGKTKTDNERWCCRYQKRHRRLLHRAGRIARSGCHPFCQQPTSHHAWGYRRGDGDNANAGNVILRGGTQGLQPAARAP